MTEIPDPDRQPDPLLRVASEERERQLREARGALAELVSELTDELRDLRGQNAALRDERDALRREVDKQLRGVAELNARLAAVQDMKVVRWTAPLRGFVYRLRGR